jgi:hypothetical protein
MALSPGVTLGPYQIESLVGAGGPAAPRAGSRRGRRRGLAVAKEART